MRPSAMAGEAKIVSGSVFVASFLNSLPACTTSVAPLAAVDVDLPVGRDQICPVDEPCVSSIAVELLAGLRVKRRERPVAGEVDHVADADRGDHVRRRTCL